MTEESETEVVKVDCAVDKRTSRALRVALLVLNLAALAIPASITLFNLIGPETWWLSSANLYVPQAIWAVPAAILIPFTVWGARRYSWIPLAAIVWVLGPIMGFCIPNLFVGKPAGVRLRVMTYNIKQGWNRAGVMAEIAREKPDILLIQEWAGGLDGSLRKAIPGCSVYSGGQFCVASAMRVTLLEAHSTFSRWLVATPLGHITLYNVHLPSPRWGIGMVARQGTDGAESMVKNTKWRLDQMERVSQKVADESGPVIVAGDLNAPSVSLVCRSLTRLRMTDAFGAAGFGYGYTYGHVTPIHRNFARIDHIFIGGHLAATDCRTGGNSGSHHAPVIADLVTH